MKIPFFDLSAEIKKHKIPLMSQISSVIDNGQFVGGPFVENFEGEFAGFTGATNCVGLGNGLDAIRLALEGLGIGPGDEVLVPSFTFYATWLAVLQVGARPVFVDVLEKTAGLDPDLCEESITSRTRALIVVHLYGIPAEMKQLTDVARRHNLHIIEDCAQAHGAQIDGKQVGTFGAAGAFSFYPTKNLGALGDAGALITSDASLAAFVKSRRSYGQGDSKYEHIDFGWNSRLDPIQAAILSHNLVLLSGYNQRRQQIASHYLEALGSRASAVVGSENSSSVWHHFVLRAADRSALREVLLKSGISTDVHYPYHSGNTPAITKYFHTLNMKEVLERDSKQAVRLSNEVVSLPIGPWMTDSQVEHVAQALSKFPSDVLIKS